MTEELEILNPREVILVMAVVTLLEEPINFTEDKMFLSKFYKLA
jgi:hypothetical protein